MRPAGLEQVELAKADGRWDAAYSSPANMTEPADLKKALKANAKAAEFYATLNKSNRYAIIYQLEDAKKPETRDAAAREVHGDARARREALLRRVAAKQNWVHGEEELAALAQLALLVRPGGRLGLAEVLPPGDVVLDQR